MSRRRKGRIAEAPEIQVPEKGIKAPEPRKISHWYLSGYQLSARRKLPRQNFDGRDAFFCASRHIADEYGAQMMSSPPTHPTIRLAPRCVRSKVKIPFKMGMAGGIRKTDGDVMVAIATTLFRDGSRRDIAAPTQHT